MSWSQREFEIEFEIVQGRLRSAGLGCTGQGVRVAVKQAIRVSPGGGWGWGWGWVRVRTVRAGTALHCTAREGSQTCDVG